MSDLVGKRLGQYDILEAVGQGGMAIVYKARQESMDRDVAIKVITGQLADKPDFIARFEREARLIAKLQHPHILPVYDFGRVDDLIYLVMRLVDGGSLERRLRGGPLPISQAARMFTQIASALSYAHDMGVIHRDLKPNNILLDRVDNPYLMDFGIARMIQDQTGLTATGTVMGTPAYMSPEQWRGEAIDARTDIYALGIMLYEMLTGDLPFKGDTPYALMYKHFDTPPPSPRSLKPELPQGIDPIIRRALAKSLAERYPSANQMADDLNNVLAGKPVADFESTETAQVQLSDLESQSTFVGEEIPGAATQSGQPTEHRHQATAQVAAPKTMSPAAEPAKTGRLPLLIAAGTVVVIALLIAGGLLITSQNTANANATATQVAANVTGTQNTILGATQTQIALVNATGTAFALLPTVTHTPTATGTFTATPTVTATASPSPMPTSVSFGDFSDQTLNVKFRYPAGWEVQKRNPFVLFVTPHYADLKFADDGTVSGPPYIQIVVGSSSTFGVQDMASAKTPMDAMIAFLGGERIQNLDQVFGTHFPAATTTRPRPEQQAIRVLYLMQLGPDRFAAAMLQTSPDLSTAYNNGIALPLVRSFDFAVPPTAAPEPTTSPTASGAQAAFAPPTDYDTYTSTTHHLSFQYPKGWTYFDSSSGILTSPEGVKTDITNPDSPPYISIFVQAQKSIFYKPELGIIDLYRDNLGSFSVNPVEINGAPYPAAYGRSLGNTELKINGWLVFVMLDENTFLSIFGQAPRGSEQLYLDTVVLPLVKSLKYQPGK